MTIALLMIKKKEKNIHCLKKIEKENQKP